MLKRLFVLCGQGGRLAGMPGIRPSKIPTPRSEDTIVLSQQDPELAGGASVRNRGPPRSDMGSPSLSSPTLARARTLQHMGCSEEDAPALPAPRSPLATAGGSGFTGGVRMSLIVAEPSHREYRDWPPPTSDLDASARDVPEGGREVRETAEDREIRETARGLVPGFIAGIAGNILEQAQQVGCPSRAPSTRPSTSSLSLCWFWWIL